MKNLIASLLLLLIGGISSASAQGGGYLNQDLDVFMTEPPTNELMIGKVQYKSPGFRVTRAEFYLVSEYSELLSWRSTQVDPVEKTIVDNLSVINFSFDLSSEDLSGGYYLYIGLFGEKEEQIGTGKKAVVFEEKTSIGDIEGVDINYNQEQEKGEVNFVFLTTPESRTVKPVVLLHENSLDGELYGRYEGDFLKTEGKTNIAIKHSFPWPTKPESYVVVVRVENESGDVLGGESIQRILVEGDFGEITSVTPNPERNPLVSGNKFDVQLRGFIPKGRDYNIVLQFDQKDKKGEIVQSDTKEDILLSDEESLFDVTQEFAISAKASTLTLQAMIKNPERDEIIEQKHFTWQNKGGQTSVKEQGPKKTGIFGFVGSLRGDSLTLSQIGVIAGIIFIFIILLLFLMSKVKKKHLGIVLVLLASTSLFLNTASATALTGYTETIYPLDGVRTVNPSALDTNLRKIVIEGMANKANIGIFEDPSLEFQRANITILSEQNSWTAIGDVDIEAKDIQMLRRNDGATGPWEKFRLVVDLGGSNFDFSDGDGDYGVRILLMFKEGTADRELSLEQRNYFIVDQTSPTLAVDPLTGEETVPSAVAKEFLFKCNDIPGTHCITSTMEGPVHIKGNFCDGIDDAGKLCDTNIAKYEICDAAGNCETYNQPFDFFYYDPFPPNLGVVDLIKSKNTKSRDPLFGDPKPVDNTSASAEKLTAFSEKEEVQNSGLLGSLFKSLQANIVGTSQNGGGVYSGINTTGTGLTSQLLGESDETREILRGTVQTEADGELEVGRVVERIKVLINGRERLVDMYEIQNHSSIVNRTRVINSSNPNDKKATPVTSGGRFGFDILDDEDVSDLENADRVQINENNSIVTIDAAYPQGPLADPNACGDQYYDLTQKDYGGGDKSPFFEDAGICKQRYVVCSNSPTHRGLWDRSSGPLSIDTCIADTGSICGDGYERVGNACERTNQCDPITEGSLVDTTPYRKSVGAPLDLNTPWTFTGDVAPSGTCTYGCDTPGRYGEKDGACVPYSCGPTGAPSSDDGVIYNSNGATSVEQPYIYDSAESACSWRCDGVGGFEYDTDTNTCVLHRYKWQISAYERQPAHDVPPASGYYYQSGTGWTYGRGSAMGPIYSSLNIYQYYNRRMSQHTGGCGAAQILKKTTKRVRIAKSPVMNLIGSLLARGSGGGGGWGGPVYETRTVYVPYCNTAKPTYPIWYNPGWFKSKSVHSIPSNQPLWASVFVSYADSCSTGFLDGVQWRKCRWPWTRRVGSASWHGNHHNTLLVGYSIGSPKGNDNTRCVVGERCIADTSPAGKFPLAWRVAIPYMGGASVMDWISYE